MTQRLTKRKVDQVTYVGNGSQHCIAWDGEIAGFGLRVYPSGRKSFILKFRTRDGTRRLLTLGRYPALTVDQARKAARLELAQVYRGEDPALARLAARAVSTFGELADAYLEGHARIHKRSVADDEQRIRDYLRPAWGTRKATKIGRGDVSSLHRQLGQKKPHLANRVLALASVMFNWGERTGLLPEGHPNPTRGIRPYPERPRDRWLTPDEVKRLLGAVATERNVYVQAYFWLALLTGARKSELLCAKWQQVDLDNGVLRLPETKAGRPHILWLSEPAQAILGGLPREARNLHVFPGRDPGSRLVNIAKPWDRVRTLAEVPEVRLHDLRRTVASWMAQSGASLQVIGQVLNHSNMKTTQGYAWLPEDASREPLELIGRTLLSIAPNPPSATELSHGE